MAYTRPLNDIRVGGEIDAVCTRCRMLTNHRIVAMVDGFVKRVICLTCQSQHNYRQPPGESKAPAAGVTRVAREYRKASSPAGERSYALWLEKSRNLTETPEPYNLQKLFAVDQALSHAKFGLGFVQKIIPPNKMEVMFEKEIKTLAMGLANV